MTADVFYFLQNLILHTSLHTRRGLENFVALEILSRELQHGLKSTNIC